MNIHETLIIKPGKTMRMIALTVSALALAGCAEMLGIDPNYAENEKRKVIEYSQTIPTCNTDKDCERKWAAAQSWVAKNAGWKVQTATDALIETYNPVGDSKAIAVRVTKEPFGQDEYRFLIEVWCSNAFGICAPEISDSKLSFNNTLNALNVGSPVT